MIVLHLNTINDSLLHTTRVGFIDSNETHQWNQLI